MKKITIYTDGSCLGNSPNSDNPGGFGAVLRYKNKTKEISGGIPSTTNNRAEMIGCIEGLKTVKESCDIILYTDSKYIVETMNNGWKRNKNKDLWNKLDKETNKHNIKFIHVKGHAGHEDNEKANTLAQLAAAAQAAGNGVNVATYGIRQPSTQTRMNI